MFVRERCAGDSTPSLTPASLATKPGQKMPGRKLAPPTTGLEWRSTPSAALCMCLQDRRSSISTELTGSATTCLPIPCLPSMRRLESASGTSRAYTTTSGTGTFPSPPALVSVKRNGKRVDAVAQTSKQGFLFLFDRTTGKPLFPIEERSYPASKIPGEVTAPTQPVPLSAGAFRSPGSYRRLADSTNPGRARLGSSGIQYLPQRRTICSHRAR